jgi:thioredoxin-related protein
MKRLTIYILFIFFVGCNSNGKEKSNIFISNSAELLGSIVTKNLNTNSEINPEISLNSIIRFYDITRHQKVISKEEPIDLYVIYGTDIWQENAETETFEITFANQHVSATDKVLYENRITLIYDFTDFVDIDEFTLYYEKNQNIENFKQSVKESIGYKMAQSKTPKRIEIIREQI